MKRTLVGVGLAIALLTLVNTYVHPQYANCKQTAEGRACDLIGYKWGK